MSEFEGNGTFMSMCNAHAHGSESVLAQILSFIKYMVFYVL